MGTRQSIQPRIISHSIDLFNGGMDSDASPYTVPQGSAVLGENVEFYRDGTLRSRKGFTYNMDPTGNLVNKFVTLRWRGSVSRIYRENNYYYNQSDATGWQYLGNASGTPEDTTLVKILNGVLVVEKKGIQIYEPTQNNIYQASVDTPNPLSASPLPGGRLKEGIYTYQYNYLLRGGADGPTSPEYTLAVMSDDSQVQVNLPPNPSHPDIFKIRLFRKGPGDAFPLYIGDVNPNTGSFTDTGLPQSALMPTQGVRQMPGGNLALLHNRRLFVVDGDTVHYSYPGTYAYSNVFWSEKINLPTGEPITAMCPLGQGIIFFGLESAVYMNGVPSEGGTFSPIPVPDGCVSQRAWTLAEDGTLLYVGKSGIYAMSGTSAQRISDPVNDEFRKLTVGQLKNSTIIFDQQERRLLTTLPDKILTYYFQTKSWSVWTINNAQLDWFEGRIYMYRTGTPTGNRFGILGEAPTDDGLPILGKFVSGVHGLDDSTVFKLFRRVGLQVSAGLNDTVNMSVRAMQENVSYSGLPAREVSGPTWGTAIWGATQWGGNTDTTQTVSLPDNIQGRYIQFTITFSTQNANQFVLMGPVVVEYRPRYRYGRR